MNIALPTNPEQIGLWAGFVLTLMVFSYLLGDNFLFRLAVYVFVGLAAGFVTIVTVESVLLPWLTTTVLAPSAPVGSRVLGLLPILFGVLLLLKSSPRIGRLGNLAIAFVVGVGTAVAIVGAITGTLVPLTNATTGSIRVDLLNGFVTVLGVFSTLIYFRFLGRRIPGTAGEIRRGIFGRFFGTIGQGFLAVTFGAIYAGAILTGLTIFSERIAFIRALFGGG